MSGESVAAADQRTEAAIRELYRALLDGWNRRDAGAMARLFAAHGNIVGFDGSQIDGPAAIEAAMGRIFADRQTPPFVAIVREVRMLAPDAALLRAVVGMPLPAKKNLNPAVNAIQSLLAARRDGQWRIELFQNTPAALHGRPEASDRLTEELRSALRSRKNDETKP